MKVLHLLPRPQRRGAEVFALDLVGALGALGVSQHVAMLSDGDGGVGFEVPTTVLSKSGGLGAGLGLRRLLRDLRPTVLQAHGGDPLKHAIPATAGVRGAPVVYRRIGSAHPLVAAGPRRLAYGWLMRRAASVVCVGRSVALETEKLFGVDPSRIHRIPNAVDADRLVPTASRADVRSLLGITADTAVITSVGALTWEKDPIAQIDVMRRISREEPRVAFLMVGEGPLEGEARSAVAQAGLEETVYFVGSRSDVPDLMAASDVLLLASRTEGMPGCLIEAGMLGLPVAAYSLASVPEVVLDGRTGLLVEPGDRAGLAAAVISLLRDRDGRDAMGTAAREWCLARFDIRAIAPSYLDAYTRLC